jgi:hypothetical protein
LLKRDVQPSKLKATGICDTLQIALHCPAHIIDPPFFDRALTLSGPVGYTSCFDCTISPYEQDLSKLLMYHRMDPYRPQR